MSYYKTCDECEEARAIFTDARVLCAACGGRGLVPVAEGAIIIEINDETAARMKRSLDTDIFAVFGDMEPRANLASRDIWLSIIASNALRAAAGEKP